MARDLATSNGQTAMMYCGQVPWHGPGQKLDGPATAAGAIRAAHLDWKVEKPPLHITRGTRLFEIPDRFVVVRTDTTTDAGAPKVLGKARGHQTGVDRSSAEEYPVNSNSAAQR